MELLTGALSLIFNPCYELTGNWWIAILLFTAIIKIILMPLSLWVQKNSIVMVQLMPALNRIKVNYFGDTETIGEKQNALYKEKHYHPMVSLIPLAVQIIILFGLVDIIHGVTDNGALGTEFLGMIPVESGGVSWVMPVLAGLSAVVMGCAQNRINPLQKEQSRAEKNMTNGLSIALSFFLGIFVAAGMAFYWICSNLLSIVVQILCNIIIKPKKYIDYKELDESRQELEVLNSLSAKRKRRFGHDPLAKREKKDFKRFFDILNKHIVFYSEGSGFYKYFRGAIEYMLDHSNIWIHYVTNDPNDQVFELSKKHPRILPYYIGEKKAITLMMKMDADVVVTTLGDLDNFYIKRSYLRDDIEYVYMFHHTTSMDMTSTIGEYDNYDTLLCTGPHQVEEMRKIEDFRGIKHKNLVECGYDLIDRGIENYSKNIEKYEQERIDDKPVVLIAPSWQKDNILDICFDDLIQPILGKGYKIIVRPHPEYVKRFPARWDALKNRYSCITEDELVFEHDFSSNETILLSDVLVTDWSSVFCEFSFETLKPSIFIDTPMKVRNENWKDYGIDSTYISLRNEVGKSLALDELETFSNVIDEMITNRSEWKEQISSIREGFFFNLGHGGEAAGKYLLNTVLRKQKSKMEEEVVA